MSESIGEVSRKGFIMPLVISAFQQTRRGIATSMQNSRLVQILLTQPFHTVRLCKRYERNHPWKSTPWLEVAGCEIGFRKQVGLTPHPAGDVLFLGADGVGIDGRGGKLGVAQPLLHQVNGNPF
jgi:hypothetical protein